MYYTVPWEDKLTWHLMNVAIVINEHGSTTIVHQVSIFILCVKTGWRHRHAVKVLVWTGDHGCYISRGGDWEPILGERSERHEWEIFENFKRTPRFVILVLLTRWIWTGGKESLQMRLICLLALLLVLCIMYNIWTNFKSIVMVPAGLPEAWNKWKFI